MSVAVSLAVYDMIIDIYESAAVVQTFTLDD